MSEPSSSWPEVRRFLRKGILFSLGAMTLFLTLNGLLEHRVDEAAKRRFHEMEHPKQDRFAVIFGDSHSANGVVPRFLERPGRSVYNFSFAGADSVYYSNWYPLFAQKYPKPKIAIIQLDWFAFLDAPYLFRSIEVDAEYLPRSTFLNLAFRPDIDKPKLWTSRFPLFQNRQKLDLLLDPNYYFSEEPMSLFEDGYVPVDRFYTQGGPLRFAPKPEREAVLRNWIQQLRASGVKVVFVQTPEFLQARQPDPAYQSQVTLFAQSLGAPFLNFNRDLASDINLDPGNFADWAHLNARGAKLFSQRLSQELEKLEVWKDL